jgi:hypothetical protein
MPPEGTRPKGPTAEEVNRLLRQLRAHDDPVPLVPAAPPRPAPPSARPRPLRPPPAPTSPGVWARVLFGVVLVVAMTQWPYLRSCGLGLAAYLASVAFVVVAGAWAAHASWRARLGHAHIAALVITVSGAVLAADVLVPRLGTWPVEAVWRCGP